jgi:hypothetical protein
MKHFHSRPLPKLERGMCRERQCAACPVLSSAVTVRERGGVVGVDAVHFG